MDKKNARTYVKNLRKSLDPSIHSEKSKIVCQNIISTKEFNESDTVFLYMAIGGETNLDLVINSALKCGKTVAIPKVIGDNLSFYQIDSRDGLIMGYMNIPEPNENIHKELIPDKGLVLVPGLAFDVFGGRAGYGRGFYDRFLGKYPMLDTMGVCFDFQVFDRLATDIFDIKMKKIITETKIIYT